MWITSLYKRKDAKMLTLTCKDMTKIFISTRGLCITIILLPKNPQRHLSEWAARHNMDKQSAWFKGVKIQKQSLREGLRQGFGVSCFGDHGVLKDAVNDVLFETC